MKQAVDPNTPKHERLSPREQQVFQRLLCGKRNQEIAADLHISPKTVCTFRMRLLTKLGLYGKAQLLTYGREHGITPDLKITLAGAQS